MFHRCSAILFAVLVACFAAAPALAQSDGSFPLTLKNDTDGRWKDSQIYVTGLGQYEPGRWGYLTPDGQLKPLDHTMATAPGHLTKDGRTYPDMSFTLAEARGARVPPVMEGGRLYISVGRPMYIRVADDDQGFAGPDLNNPADPNADTVFDWYELAYAYGRVHFGGNTTQVDQFGLPMVVRAQQDATGFDETRGIRLSRAQVFDRFRDAVSKPFRSLITPERILAPRTSDAFAARGPYADYLDPAIDRAWNAWKDGFEMTRLHQTFAGEVRGGKLHFSVDGKGAFAIGKPTSEDVFKCRGPLVVQAGDAPEEGVMGAEVCAAFNRGVGTRTSDWYKPSTYYDGKLDNEFSGFFHRISIDGWAYGFPYDDINAQSSVTIVPNAQPLSRLTISVGW